MKNSCFRRMLPVLFLLFSFPGLSQTRIDTGFVLNTTLTGTKEYIALGSITLQPGFSYTATPGHAFTGRIAPLSVSPPAENTYAMPDGAITANPALGSVVGSIPGSFAVSPSGAATYTIPIEVPQGINGLQPGIALVYNSQSGNGIAGWGFTIAGLSAITVGNKTIFSDNAVSGLDLSQKADYYLDGNKLIVKTGFIYGALHSEYETENETYVQIKQTESANNYPSKFTVTSKEGTIIAIMIKNIL